MGPPVPLRCDPIGLHRPRAFNADDSDVGCSALAFWEGSAIERSAVHAQLSTGPSSLELDHAAARTRESAAARGRQRQRMRLLAGVAVEECPHRLVLGDWHGSLPAAVGGGDTSRLRTVLIVISA